MKRSFKYLIVQVRQVHQSLLHQMIALHGLTILHKFTNGVSVVVLVVRKIWIVGEIRHTSTTITSSGLAMREMTTMRTRVKTGA